MSDFEGLDDSSYFDRVLNGQDYWINSYKRGSPKGNIEVAWNHVSPTQIENFLKCKRSWFFKSILKTPETQKGHQSLGEAFHLILEKVPQGLGYSHADVAASPEDWAKAEEMAKHALPLIPTSPKIKREHSIRLETYENGPTMVGYIDIGVPSGIGWPALLIPPTEAIVGDYKTLSDFRYMKNPQELADSVQMMTYAKWAIEQWPLGLHAENDPLPEFVRLLHLYARTKPPFGRTAIRNESAIVTPDQINEKWSRTLDTVREMHQTSTCSDFNDVEGNGALNGHCEAYGGCSFRDKCGIAKSTGIKSLFQISKKPTPPTQENTPIMGSAILDKIRAAQEAAKLKAASALPSQSTATSATAANSSPVVTQVTPSVASTPGTIASNNQNQPASTNTGIIPPDAPKREQEVITKPGDAVVDPTKIIEGDSDEDDEEDTDSSDNTSGNASVPVVSSSVSFPSTNSSEPVKKRGRPSAADLAAREAAQQKAFNDAVDAKVREALANGGTRDAYIAQERDQLWESERVDLQKQVDITQETNRKLVAENERLFAEVNKARNALPLAPQQDGLTLYVDCFPTKGDREITDFFEWIGPICAQVAQQNSVGDWRQINYTAKGLLANAIRETIKEHGLPKSLTLSTYAGGADIALEILTPLAKRVIKKL